MKSLTQEQQLDNCVLALAHWAVISPYSVDLHAWTCGSQACFGGYVATWPEFKVQGVRRATSRDRDNYGTSVGAPVCGTGHARRDEHAVAAYLFGDAELFNTRGNNRADTEVFRKDPSATSHALIVERLHCQIERLSEELLEEQE